MGALKNRLHRLAAGKKQLGFLAPEPLYGLAVSGLPFGLDQVPEIAVEIGEHRHRAIGFVAWRLVELDAFRQHCLVVAGKIVGFEKEKDPAAGLVADAACLLLAGSFRQEQPRALALGRRDGDPALAAAKVASSVSSKPSRSTYQEIASS